MRPSAGLLAVPGNLIQHVNNLKVHRPVELCVVRVGALRCPMSE